MGERMYLYERCTRFGCFRQQAVEKAVCPFCVRDAIDCANSVWVVQERGSMYVVLSMVCSIMHTPDHSTLFYTRHIIYSLHSKDKGATFTPGYMARVASLMHDVFNNNKKHTHTQTRHALH